jgi:hypothetical protein
MTQVQQLTNGTALAIVAKAYLRSVGAKNYDMRVFEFCNEGTRYTKIPDLLRSVEFLQLDEIEQKAVSILKDLKIQSLENDIDYAIGLVKD